MGVDRIHVDVFHFVPVVPFIPYRLLVKSRMPNLHFVGALLVNVIGTSALDELYRLLKGCFAVGSKEQMQMIGHNNKLVQQIRTLIAVLQHAPDQDLSILLYLKDRMILPCLRCNEVSAARSCPML
jgi:hypothetical protein